ncbi:MAG: hypothetical protein M3Q17_02155 [Actinomycetota bacterium]|nr:hypothetical protein [Actinomycetota bacterium]
MGVQQVSERAGGRVVETRTAPQPADRELPDGPTGRWVGVSLVGLGVAIGLVRLVEPRFFLSGDKQAMFLPAMRDIGRRLLDGEFPVIDPDLAAAGNYALNLQYGLYDPFQLLLAMALSRIDNLLLAATLWSVTLLAVLCAGMCALLLRLRVPGWWAAAGAVGVALAGYTLYQLAPSWISAMGSLVWIPWWWRSWYGRRGSRWSLAGLAVFGYLLVATGWPFTWLAVAFIGIGLVAEEVLRRPRDRGADESRLWLRSLVSRVLAALGGALAGATVAVPMLMAYEYTVRTTAIADDGRWRPNFADLLSVASPTHSMYVTVPGESPGAPVFFVGWFIAVLVWGVAWSRDTWRVPGVLSAGIATLLSALMTQMPMLLGPLRQGLRNLEGFQLCVVVLVVVAYVHSPARWTRGRVVGAVSTAVATGFLAWGQLPTSSPVLVGAALVLGCVVALVGLFHLVGPGGRWAAMGRAASLPAGFALVTTVLLTGWVVHTYPYPAGYNHGLTDPAPTAGPGVVGGVPTLTLFDDDVESIEVRQQLYRNGIGYGFTRLSESYRPLNGVSSVGQRFFNERLCIGWYGDGCPAVAERLTETEPTTGRTWIDLLGVEQVQVAPGPLTRAWRRAAGPEWELSERVKDVTVYQRIDELPVVGRITEVDGPAAVSPLDLQNAQQSYRVDAGDTETRLVFRDIYFPGYTATLGGVPLDVDPVADVFVSVVIPAGLFGELVVSYTPAGGGLRLGLWIVGGLVVVAALFVARPLYSLPRASRTPPDG